ncbi:MAG: STN domain-containing protein, partial [Prosthecobacter sp.]|nr:STN domain-containing protein [Prosthecobacter sp.]
MSLPAAGGTEGADASQTVRATLPHLEMPQARRFHGTWVVEANTDTQLSFESQSMQPLDVLRAPLVVDYQPRHRLVSAFTYGAGAHELKITAQRHEHSELAVLVVNRLLMTSVLSTDGTSRHEAIIHLRHSGEQFVPVRLPPEARLLSVLVEHAALKPVRGEDGVLSIPLPADSANRANVRVVILYDLPGESWGGAGKRQLTPVIFPGNIPILATEWRVHVPEGFSYGEIKTRMEQAGNEPARDLWNVLLGMPEKQSFTSSDDPHDENPVDLSKRTNKLDSIVIPQVQFNDATLEEAIEFLRVKSRDLDTDGMDSAQRGVNLLVKDGDTPVRARISLNLKDVPLGEALRYVTELAGMKYKVEPYAVVVVPVSDTTMERYTRGYRLPPNFLSSTAGAAGPSTDTGLKRQPTAIDTLKAQGIPFPEGTSAVFNPVTSQLIVTQTQANLDLIEAVLDARTYKNLATEAAKSGLLPLDLELPTSGILLRFRGAQAPEPLTLRFMAWERQLAMACLWMLLGAAGFAAWGRRRVWWRTFLVALLLTAAVSLAVPSWFTAANAILVGWLIALAAWLIWRCSQRLARTVENEFGQEVAV